MQPTGTGADALTLPFLSVTLFTAVALTTALSAGVWVQRDAAARGSSSPHLWGFTAVFGPGLFVYLVFRRLRGIGPRSEPAGERDRALATWTFSGVTALLGGAVLSPPDPISMTYWGLASFAVALPVGYLLVFRRGYRRVLGAGERRAG